MMSDGQLTGVDPEKYNSEVVTVSGQPKLGNVVEVQYHASAGGSFRTSDPTTIRGELLYAVRPFGLEDDDRLEVVIHDAERNRQVGVRLKPDPGKHSRGNVRTLARKTDYGQRIGKVASVTFSDEAVNRLSPAMNAILPTKPGDTILIDGCEYGVISTSEYGPSERPARASAVLTRPDGSEFVISIRDGDVSFSVRYGDEVEIDPSSVKIGRVRERYYNHVETPGEPEDTDDAFPAPHYAREGERLSFILTGEDREDERVSGVVTDVRYYRQLESHLFSDPEEQDQETTVELDDGREVRLTNTTKRRNTVITRSRREELGENGYVRAWVITRHDDADNEYERIDAVDLQVDEGGDVETDGGSNGPELIADGGESVEPTHGYVRGPAHLLDSAESDTAICGAARSMSAAFDIGDDDPLEDYPDLCGNCERILKTRRREDEPVTDGGRDVETLANSVGRALAASDVPMENIGVSVSEVDGDVTIQSNVHLTRDGWDNLRDRILETLDAEGFQYNTKSQWAFIEVTGREIRTDGGMAGVDDPHLEIKQKLIRFEPVMMVGTDNKYGYLTVYVSSDGDDAELEKIRLTLELSDYVELDPSEASDLTGVTADHVRGEVWKHKGDGANV